MGIFVEKHFEVKEYWEKLNFELECSSKYSFGIYK